MTSRLRVRRLLPGLVGLGLAGLFARAVSAQDLTITNARIIVGNGTVIERGIDRRARRQDRVRGGRARRRRRRPGRSTPRA